MHSLIQILILIVMFMPAIAAVIVNIHLYAKYDARGLLEAGRSWQELAERIAKLPHYQKKNLDSISQHMSAVAVWHTKNGWQRLVDDARERFRESLLPEISAYFPYDKNISIPYARKTMENLGQMSFALAVLGFIWPILLVLNILPRFPELADYIITDSAATLGLVILPSLFVDTVTIGILSVTLIVLSYLLFSLMDKKVLGHAEEKYKLFLDALTASLPTADNQGAAALLSMALYENKEAFNKTAETIAQRLNEFAGNELAPAIGQVFTHAVSEKLMPLINYNHTLLEERLEQTIALQENGMRELADGFAEKLTSAIEPRLSRLGKDFDAISQAIAATNSQLSGNNDELHKLFDIEENLLKQFNLTIADLRTSQHQTADANLELSQSLNRVEKVMGELFQTAENDREERLSALREEKLRQDEIFAQLAANQEQTEAILREGRENVESYREAFLSVTARLEESVAALTQRAENMDEITRNNTTELMDLIGAENRELTGSLTAAMNDILTESRESIITSRDALNSLSEKLEAAVNQMTGEIESISNAARTNALEMVNLIGEENLTLTRTLIGTMEEHLNLNMENMIGGLEKAMTANLETNTKLAEVERFLSEVIPLQYKAMSEDISSMLHKLNSSVFEAMDGAGKSIAQSIIEAGANNSEIVQKLAEQYNKLTQDYETYFTHMDDTTQKTLQEMDYQVNMIISRINDEFRGIVEQATVENKDSLEQYRVITANILATFEDQAHSISLYAKEINIDVQSLSENLNESVKQFNSELSGGVSGTLELLDQGMADLQERIANTVESICDAIEELPKIINRK